MTSALVCTQLADGRQAGSRATHTNLYPLMSSYRKVSSPTLSQHGWCTVGATVPRVLSLVPLIHSFLT